MSTDPRSPGDPVGGTSSVDVGMAHLLRLVLADDWRVATASSRLRQIVHDRRILSRMAARVERALHDRSSTVAERAALTVRAAIIDLADSGAAAAGAPAIDGREERRPGATPLDDDH